MDEYDSRHGKGASCSEAENCKDEFMTAVKESYRDFFYNNFFGQEAEARQVEGKIELHKRYHSIAELVWRGTSDEIYQGCSMALQEWIENGYWQGPEPSMQRRGPAATAPSDE